jgi:hypothetical protein
MWHTYRAWRRGQSVEIVVAVVVVVVFSLSNLVNYFKFHVCQQKMTGPEFRALSDEQVDAILFGERKLEVRPNCTVLFVLVILFVCSLSLRWSRSSLVACRLISNDL